jgi:hypothetical protein
MNRTAPELFQQAQKLSAEADSEPREPVENAPVRANLLTEAQDAEVTLRLDAFRAGHESAVDAFEAQALGRVALMRAIQARGWREGD